MELDDYQKGLLRASSQTRGRGGYASASSGRHLERAIKLKSEMPEVAVFLAITAEEEAATAVFSALRKRRYEGARHLKDKDHVFKASLYPFIKLLGNTVGALKLQLPVQLFFDPKEGQPSQAILRIRMQITADENDELFLVPNPPLNLVSTDPGGEKTDYFGAIRNVASEKGIDSIHDHCRKWANRRNQMLYASDSAIPEAKSVDEWLLPHFKGVFANLAAYLLIEPHPRQNFVQEALAAFLKIHQGFEARET